MNELKNTMFTSKMKFLTFIHPDDCETQIGGEMEYVFGEGGNETTYSICPQCSYERAEPYETKTEGIFLYCDDCGFKGIGKRPIMHRSYEDVLRDFPDHKEVIEHHKNYLFAVCELALIMSALPMCDSTPTEERFNEHGIDIFSFDVSKILGHEQTMFDFCYIDADGVVYDISD